MLRYVSHPGLIPASQGPSVVKLFRSKVKTKSAEHVSSVASRHSKRELNRCMLSGWIVNSSCIIKEMCVIYKSLHIAFCKQRNNILLDHQIPHFWDLASLYLVLPSLCSSIRCVLEASACKF